MKKIGFALLLLTLLQSCDNEDISKAGIGFNANRNKIGLPLLNPDWKLVKNLSGVFQWMPLERIGYCSKLVVIEDGKFKREENHFKGKKGYNTIDGSFFEDVYITCYFEDSLKVRWECVFNSENVFSKNISKAEADSIVKSWGLQYWK